MLVLLGTLFVVGVSIETPVLLLSSSVTSSIVVSFTRTFALPRLCIVSIKNSDMSFSSGVLPLPRVSGCECASVA